MTRLSQCLFRLSSYSVAALVLLLPFAGEVRAQSVVGRVIDGSSGTPIHTAEVALLDSTGAPVGLAITNAEGRFSIRVAHDGVYRLEANAPGYAPLITKSLEVAYPEIVTVELRLGLRPIEVDGIDVVTTRSVPAPLADYYWRLQRSRTMGFTTMLDRTQLSALEGNSARTVISRQAFTRVSTRGGPPRLLFRSRGHGGGYCEPAYYLDNLPVDGLTILMMPVADLEGIEIARGAGCGVVRAWIRRTP